MACEGKLLAKFDLKIEIITHYTDNTLSSDFLTITINNLWSEETVTSEYYLNITLEI